MLLNPSDNQIPLFLCKYLLSPAVVTLGSPPSPLPAVRDSQACVSIRPTSFVNPVNVLSCPLLYKEDNGPHSSDVLITRSPLQSYLRPPVEAARGCKGLRSRWGLFHWGTRGLSLCHGTAATVRGRSGQFHIFVFIHSSPSKSGMLAGSLKFTFTPPSFSVMI